MADYSFAGKGHFGGTNNFFGMLGGIGESWGDGIEAGIKVGTLMQQYQHLINTSPSAQRAQIAKNVHAQTDAELSHYMLTPQLREASYIASGQAPTQWQSVIANGGSVNASGGYGVGGTTANTQGTPTVTQPNRTPATTVAQPHTPPTTAKPTNTTWAAPMRLPNQGTTTPQFSWVNTMANLTGFNQGG